MRGKPLRSLVQTLDTRIIPAHAGQTSVSMPAGVSNPDHPRACGANETILPPRHVQIGSSPRMRGKPLICGAKPNCVRIIPAHAGQT